ncbi:hypothetical protein F4780DRAFT_661624 [Xylariomycetidae sp. FL0641]|nr:hypothetical protein F4780DRAFT_661624 [Xylariomycetidae sp. FL0641]
MVSHSESWKPRRPTADAKIRGLVAAFQAFQKGLPAYLITRILLGLCEAGFVPAALYTMTLWYTTSELSKRFAIFWTGSILSNAFGGLVAFGMWVRCDIDTRP